MADQNDPGRARRLFLLRQVEHGLTELFAHANGLGEVERAAARTFLRDMFSRTAATSAPAAGARALTGPTSGPHKAAPRLVVARPANDGSKGPLCDRCQGAGRWSGDHGGSGPCFACKGTGVQRSRARGAR